MMSKTTSVPIGTFNSDMSFLAAKERYHTLCLHNSYTIYTARIILSSKCGYMVADSSKKKFTEFYFNILILSRFEFCQIANTIARVYKSMSMKLICNMAKSQAYPIMNHRWYLFWGHDLKILEN